MIRRAFSTLGCPDTGLDEVLALAAADPCTGIELRCAPGQLAQPGMTDADADALAARLREADLDVVCLASYVRVSDDRSDVVADLERHLRLAAGLGAPLLRVFGGDGPRARAVRSLTGAAPLAEALGVGIALETHDEFRTGRQVAEALAAVGSPAVGAVWDAVHPWRTGESPERTAAELAPWLRHVQLKDVASADDLRPVLCGDGVLPLAAVLDQLQVLGYAGWISLEWERAWFLDAAPLDRALAAFHDVLDQR